MHEHRDRSAGRFPVPTGSTRVPRGKANKKIAFATFNAAGKL